MAELDVRDASKMLADDYALRILVGALHRPRSTQELADAFGIPIAVCYRRVAALQRLGLLECCGRVLTSRAKWVRVYRSQLKGAYIVIERGKMYVRFELRDNSLPGAAQWQVVDPFGTGGAVSGGPAPELTVPMPLEMALRHAVTDGDDGN